MDSIKPKAGSAGDLRSDRERDLYNKLNDLLRNYSDRQAYPGNRVGKERMKAITEYVLGIHLN